MPIEFTNCVKNGGRVRTKSLPNNQYLHICFPKGGGPSISGEVKTAQTKQRKLSYQQKKNLPKKSFVYPGKRKFPINDKAHARNALARVSQFGTPAEKKAVRSAVAKKFPSIQMSKARSKRLQSYL